MMRLNASMNSVNAIKKIAVSARQKRVSGLIFIFFSALALSGCGFAPDKPQRAQMYDFGPGELSARTATRQAALPPLAIDEIATSGGALDNLAVLYRLGYEDAQQLRPYSLARWSMPPAQLVRQRLLGQLGQRRAVFNAGSSIALNRNHASALPLRLRIDLEEFSQLFTTPESSVGLIRLRATLVDITPTGEKLLGQRNVVVQRPASSADAAGGVRALTAATDAAIDEINDWLQQTAGRP